MLHFEKSLFFRVEMHQLVLIQNLMFAHDFESIDLWFSSELDELDSAEGAVSKGGEDFQIVAF